MVFPIAVGLITIELIAIWVLRMYFVGYFVFLISRFLSKGAAVWIYSISTLPGLLIHEMSHFLIAAVMGLRTGKIELLPVLTDSGGVEFGSVQVEKVDPIRLALVGIAPTMVGLPLIAWMSLKLEQNPWIWGYLMSCAALHLLPSKRDLTYWPVIIPLIVGMGWLGLLFSDHLLVQSMLQGLLVPVAVLLVGIAGFRIVGRIVQ
jgi:hypothetical protein